MSDLIIREIEDGDEDAVIALWQACDLTRPWNDPAADLAYARDKPDSQILVGLSAKTDGNPGRIIASAMIGHDGHRGAMYYVAVHPDMRGKSYGRIIMAAGENWLAAKGVWAVRLMVRTGNEAVLKFYDRLGYKPSEVTVMGKYISQDNRGSAKGKSQ